MGIGITEDGKFVNSIILNPFERKLFYSETGEGAFVSKLGYDNGKLVLIPNSERRLSTDLESNSLKDRYAWVDALFNAKTSGRKTRWIDEIQKTGLSMNVRMTGSNIDYSTKIAEARGHFQLTDAIGGYFDLAGCNLIEEAGGEMTNLDGNQPTPKDHLAIAVANPRDLEKVLDITRKCYEGYSGFR